MPRIALTKDVLDTLCRTVSTARGSACEVMECQEGERTSIVHLWLSDTWTNIKLTLRPQPSGRLGITDIEVSRLLDPDTCLTHDVTARVALEFHANSGLLEPWNPDTPLSEHFTQGRVTHMLRIIDKLFSHSRALLDREDIYT